jgi:hypothetical protein
MFYHPEDSPLINYGYIYFYLLKPVSKRQAETSIFYL